MFKALIKPSCSILLYPLSSEIESEKPPLCDLVCLVLLGLPIGCPFLALDISGGIVVKAILLIILVSFLDMDVGLRSSPSFPLAAPDIDFLVDEVAEFVLLLAPRCLFLMTSVFKLKGRTTPCNFKNNPHALHKGWPCGFLLHKGVVLV